MPPRLDTRFAPITANPARRDDYVEIAPCGALAPYVRCFWGSPGRRTDAPASGGTRRTLVVPDLCMDIIVSGNGRTGAADCSFCGINDAPFYAEERGEFRFGIRFYAWSAALFSAERMDGALNALSPADAYFPGFSAELSERLCGADGIFERARIAEAFLLKRLDEGRGHPSVMNAVSRIIRRSARTDVAALSAGCAVSQRTLERRCMEGVGVPPKTLLRLVRYQLLWQACLAPGFSALDAVERLGFCDQSHLLREFKKFHGMTLEAARAAYFGQLAERLRQPENGAELSHLSKTRTRIRAILEP